MIHLIQEQALCLQKALENHMTKIILGLMAFLAPIQGILITVGVLILSDTIIGIWKARKLKEKISSRKLSQIISKMFLYEGTIILFFMIDKFMLGDILQQFFAVEFLLTKVVALVLASIEVFSMDENYRAVRTYGLWHAFKKLVGRAKDVKDELKDFDIDNLK
jgi:multisubunit Na+/H+ antiporter MnhG subunit